MSIKSAGAIAPRNIAAAVLRAAAGARILAFGIAVATVAAAGTQPARAGDAGVCARTKPLQAVSGSSQIPTPCTAAPGTIRVETLYYQNASKIGGTALAGYPMLQIAAGVARRVDVVFDPPAQIAESGLRGAGLYPRSHSSYGFRYRFSQTARAAFTVGLAVSPPASLYAPSETQAKSLLDVNSAYELTPALTIHGIAQVSTSYTAGAGRVLPAQALGADIALGSSTILAPDIGLRSVTGRAQPQSFGDVCLKHALDRNVVFDVGLGTAFNPVARAKTHYLATGLGVKL